MYDRELHFDVIANNFQPPQNFTFPEAELSLVLFALKGFHGFVILARWEDGTYCLSSNFFGHKNGSSSLEYFYKKSYLTWPTAVKTFKKHQNTPERTHKKDQVLRRKFLDECT